MPVLHDAGPPAHNFTSFPKLLSVDVDDTMDSHKSYELAKALASYSTKMATIEEELSKLEKQDKTFKGHNSEDLANAFKSYSKAHQGQGIKADFVKMTNGSTSSLLYTTSASTPASVLLLSSAYTWTALLTQLQWAKVIYCIVWVTSGLILVFFGYASFFWLNRNGSGRSTRASPLGSHPHNKSRQRDDRPILSGGVGGLLMGFLFFSYLASVIHNTLCADDGKKALSAGAFFGVWLLSGILGATSCGYFFFMAKVATSVLGGTSLILIITATFGIEAILIRAILLAIIVTFLTAPLLAPRINAIQKLVINACTSLAGIVNLLNGIALFAPSHEASSNWIDLWTMLFCSNTSPSKTSIISAWGSGAFKGYIAGAILGAVVGFLFELFFHSQSGTSADSEWNEYLGTYTSKFDLHSSSHKSRLDLATSMGAAARAGLFEPAPSAWQKMVDYFDADKAKYPAQYGNLSRVGTSSESITDKARKRISTKRATKNGPARFQALSNRDDFGDQESICSSDEDDDTKDVKDHINDSGDEETNDLLSSLSKLQRPPLSSPSSFNASVLSGTTANNSTQSRVSSSQELSEKQRHPSLPSPAAVAATPSLINAITRIQAAQEAARNWHQSP
jgi:hypothetical protein